MGVYNPAQEYAESLGHGGEAELPMMFPFATRGNEISLRMAAEEVNPKTGLKPIEEHLQREVMIDKMIVDEVGLMGGTQAQIQAVKDLYRDTPYAALEEQYLTNKRSRMKRINPYPMDLKREQLYDLGDQINSAGKAITLYQNDPALKGFRDSPYGEATLLELRAKYDKLIEQYETIYKETYGDEQ